MIKNVSCAVALGVALIASPAAACKGTNSLFTDDFREVDESWGSDADNVSAQDGRVVIKPAEDKGYKILYKTTSFDSFDYCVTVRMPNNLHVSNPTGDSDAGLIFWASDYSNSFVFLVSANGQVGVQRLIKDK